VAGQALLRRPRDVATMTLATPLGGRGTVFVAERYVGRRDDFDYGAFTRVTLPPYARTDVAGEYRLTPGQGALPGLTLTARVENLFDTPYAEIKNFLAPRRALLVGGRLN